MSNRVRFCRDYQVIGDVAAEKENELTAVAYRDDCSDARYFRGA